VSLAGLAIVELDDEYERLAADAATTPDSSTAAATASGVFAIFDFI